MKKYSLTIALLTLICAPYSQAQWYYDSSDLNFTGTDLSQQSSFSAIRNVGLSGRQSLSYIRNDHEEVTDVFERNQRYEGLHFHSTSKLSKANVFRFSSQVSRDEQNFSSVITQGKWLFGLSAGQGKNFVKSTQAFTGINPYFVHGGSATKFNYYGANAGYNIADRAVAYLGSSTVKSDRLEDRQADYLGFETKKFSASLMSFKRGQRRIGKGLDIGFKFNKYRLGYRQIGRNNGAHSKSISIEWPTSRFKAGKLGFAVESVNNPLYREQDDLKFMLTLSGQWGKPSAVFHVEETEQEEEVETAGMNKMAVIGGAVVAGAVIASSGSSGKDSEQTSPAQHQAARRILNRINPVSVRENREYGGVIYRNPDGSYSNTEPVAGNNSSVLIPLAVPAGTQRAAFYHTHAAADPRFDNENFSPTDINSARQANLDSYLGTPAGAFKFYDVSEGRVSRLGTIAN